MEQDLYSRILDIAPGPRPPDHYTLLGLAWFERDAETIHRAGLQRMKALKAWDLHPDVEIQTAVQDIQNQVGAALATLEDDSHRRRYELALAGELGIGAPALAGAGPEAAPTGAPPTGPGAAVASAPVPPPLPAPATAGVSAVLRAAIRGCRWGVNASTQTRLRALARAGVLVLLACNTVVGPIWLISALRARASRTESTGMPVRHSAVRTGLDREVTPAVTPEALVQPGGPRAGAGRRASAGTTAMAPVSGKPWTVPELGMELVWVAPGSFEMGSDDGAPDEKPRHTVQISRGFWLGAVEVTQPEYWAISGKKPSQFRGPLNPVESVSWRDAMGYCRLLTAREQAAGRVPAGYEYRLPTEAEWEYAARGGAQSRGYLYSGSDAADEVAWHSANSWETACPVGQKRPNELGLYDMGGNVWEWCLDGYDAGYYATSPDVDPVNLRVTAYRTARGGSWDRQPTAVRVAIRDRRGPGDATEFLGLRVCLAPALDPGESAEDLARGPLAPRAAAADRPSKSFSFATGDTDEVPAPPSPRASRSTRLGGPVGGQHWAIPDLGMQFVWLASGSFRMGSDSGAADEQPEHAVLLLHGFWMGMCEVTQAEYEGITGRNPSRFKGARNPVETVSWNDAAAYCVKLTERERSASRLPTGWQYGGYEYRLPTEAEWEYVARGGERSMRFTYSGSNGADEVAWHNANSGGTTHPVGQKQPNELGLYDMSGNVWEWCLDGYGEAYYAASPENDPANLAMTTTRVYRGGSWGIAPQDVRTVYRNRGKPDNAISGLGFRVCLAPAAASLSTYRASKPAGGDVGRMVFRLGPSPGPGPGPR